MFNSKVSIEEHIECVVETATSAHEIEVVYKNMIAQLQQQLQQDLSGFFADTPKKEHSLTASDVVAAIEYMLANRCSHKEAMSASAKSEAWLAAVKHNRINWMVDQVVESVKTSMNPEVIKTLELMKQYKVLTWGEFKSCTKFNKLMVTIMNMMDIAINFDKHQSQLDTHTNMIKALEIRIASLEIAVASNTKDIKEQQQVTSILKESTSKEEAAKALLAQGMKKQDIAKQLGVSRPTLNKLLAN